MSLERFAKQVKIRYSFQNFQVLVLFRINNMIVLVRNNSWGKISEEGAGGQEEDT